MKILQVCNVGDIVGGTAACAWTITRALPHCDHHVVFLGPIRPETYAPFAPHPLESWQRVSALAVARTHADVVILHNTHRTRCDPRLPAVSLLYQHSQLAAARADLHLYCSAWLAERCRAPLQQVCLQAVPIPPRCDLPGTDTRALRAHPVVGRLCTPQPRKWPAELPGFYRALAQRHPDVCWEFVGCPPSLQADLQAACAGRARFFPAGWQARSRLWTWDALLYHHPTLTESFGRTVAEALRAGCIPIVDRRGGFREQIPAGGGFLCDTRDDFDSALAAISSPADRRPIARAGQTHAHDRFSLRRFARDLLQRFDQAAARGAT